MRDALATLVGEGVFKDREAFTARLKAALKAGRVILSPTALKGVLAALGVFALRGGLASAGTPEAFDHAAYSYRHAQPTHWHEVMLARP